MSPAIGCAPRRRGPLAWIVLLCLYAACGAALARTDPVPAVQSRHPLAFFRLDAAEGRSEAGAATYRVVGGARAASGGVSAGASPGAYLLFDGRTGFVDTSQSAGIQSAGTLMAWVMLTALPSSAGHILYVAGASQSGNDFDLQFESDDRLKLYTAGGSNLSFAPRPDTLLGRWHLIVVTVDAPTRRRSMYWDGAPVATDDGAAGMRPKTAPMTIGNSKVFPGRFFPGGIADVALWNVALGADDVKAIFASYKLPAAMPEASLPAAPMCSRAPPPGPKPPADLSALPPYLGFLAGFETTGRMEQLAWDEVQFPPSPWGDGSNGRRGRTFSLQGVMAQDCNDKQLAWATLKSGFLAAGWTVHKEFSNTQPLMATMHYAAGSIEAWANIGIGEPPRVGLQVVEVAPLPIHLVLAPPGPTPEKVAADDREIPYLPPLPGSKPHGGFLDNAPMTVMLPGASQGEVVAGGVIIKRYDPAPGLSNLEFVTVYREALAKAGWTIASEFNSADAELKAHYGLNGRNVWADLHIGGGGYSLGVADSGSAGEMAQALGKDCHVSLTGVLFDFDKTSLKPESDAVLERVKALLDASPALRLEVQGHTDNVGNDSYNQALSEGRAAAVVGWLKQHGIDALRLSARGYGKTRPVADNANELGRARNRRVEIFNPQCQARR